MRPEVEAAIERAVGSRFFLLKPTAKRLAAWRARAHDLSAREAGYAFAAYGQLKVATVVEDAAAALFRLGGGGDRARREHVRRSVWRAVRAAGLTDPDAVTARGAREDVILFLRNFDLAFRTRRLRFVARQLADAEGEAAERVRQSLHATIGDYRARESVEPDAEARAAALAAGDDPDSALAALARLLDLRTLDEAVDARLAEAFGDLPRTHRRALILTYLGYPFYDVATLPLLQGEGLDEFDPIKVDRISPEDAVAIRSGGPAATLKGIQFNSFGAFFSRAYRENDYLWGRLHGADRMIDIVLSALPVEERPPPERSAAMKREAFRAILAEERPRLAAIAELFEALDAEIG